MGSFLLCWGPFTKDIRLTPGEGGGVCRIRTFNCYSNVILLLYRQIWLILQLIKFILWVWINSAPSDCYIFKKYKQLHLETRAKSFLIFATMLCSNGSTSANYLTMREFDIFLLVLRRVIMSTLIFFSR